MWIFRGLWGFASSTNLVAISSLLVGQLIRLKRYVCLNYTIKSVAGYMCFTRCVPENFGVRCKQIESITCLTIRYSHENIIQKSAHMGDMICNEMCIQI